MIVYVAADLLWATRIKGTADQLGIPCRPVRSLDMLRARLGEGGVRGVIVDLEAGDLALEVIRAVRLHEARGGGGGDQGGVPDGGGSGGRGGEGVAAIVAFGPHVEVEAFAAAKAAGADRVLARGAFDRGLVEVLRGLSGA
jgi:hypothetical protein